MTRPVPEGFHTVNCVLNLAGAAAAIDFYQQAFGAEVVMRFDRPDGVLAMAMLKIGDSRILLEEAMRDPATTSGILLYVEDADATWQRAVAAGAEVVYPIADKPWGDRWGMVADRWGTRWAIATHREDVSPEEMRRRMDAARR
jgi:PhnB protein